MEPLPEFELFLRQICSAYRAQYVLAAASSTSTPTKSAPAFVREHGHFRQSHAYVTREQRKSLNCELDPLHAGTTKK